MWDSVLNSRVPQVSKEKPSTYKSWHVVNQSVLGVSNWFFALTRQVMCSAVRHRRYRGKFVRLKRNIFPHSDYALTTVRSFRLYLRSTPNFRRFRFSHLQSSDFPFESSNCIIFLRGWFISGYRHVWTTCRLATVSRVRAATCRDSVTFGVTKTVAEAVSCLPLYRFGVICRLALVSSAATSSWRDRACVAIFLIVVIIGKLF